jgi:hypothetical protein
MYPKQFPFPNDPKRWAEFQTYKAFSELDGSWAVFYGLAWQGQVDGRQKDGECDFVLLHAKYGLYAVEVKGGSEIGVVDGQRARRASNASLSRREFAGVLDDGRRLPMRNSQRDTISLVNRGKWG